MATINAESAAAAIVKRVEDITQETAADMAQAVNEGLEAIKASALVNIPAAGIKTRTGRLVAGIKTKKARPPRNGAALKITGRVSSTAVSYPVPKRPGVRNPDMANRYKHGVPYARIIEFSPRINRPYFYPAVDSNKEQIRRRVVEAFQRGRRKK